MQYSENSGIHGGGDQRKNNESHLLSASHMQRHINGASNNDNEGVADAASTPGALPVPAASETTSGNLLLQNMSNTSLADVVYFLNDQSFQTMDSSNFDDQVLAVLSPTEQQFSTTDNEECENSRLDAGNASRKRRKCVLQLPNPPRTAYILFMNSNKEQWIKDNPNVKFNEFQKHSSVIWKQMSAIEKQRWRDEEAEDRKRFLAEVAASSPEVQAQIALAAQGVLRRKEQNAEGTDNEAAIMSARGGKGPRTAFVIYMQEMRESYMSKHIGITFNEFQTQMSQQWRALSEEEKFPFIARERAEKAEHMYRSMLHISNGQVPPEVAIHVEGLRAAAAADPRNPTAAPGPPRAYPFVRADEFHRCLAVMQRDIQMYVSSLAQDFGNQLLMQQEQMHIMLDRSLSQMHTAYSTELNRLSMECARNHSEIETLRLKLQTQQKQS